MDVFFSVGDKVCSLLCCGSVPHDWGITVDRGRTTAAAAFPERLRLRDLKLAYIVPHPN